MIEVKEFLCSDTEDHYIKNGFDLKNVPTLSIYELNGKIQIDADEVDASVRATFTPSRAVGFAKELIRLAAIAEGNYTDPRVEVSIGVALRVIENPES
jgi:hypothetical protein